MKGGSAAAEMLDGPGHAERRWSVKYCNQEGGIDPAAISIQHPGGGGPGARRSRIEVSASSRSRFWALQNRHAATTFSHT